MQIKDIIGYIGCFLVSTILISQLYKTYKTKDITGISIYFIYQSISANLFMITYGILDKSFPVIIANGLLLISNFIFLCMYFKFSNVK